MGTRELIMPIFANGLPRWPVLVVALGAFLLLPPQRFAHGPDLCLWRHLFHLAACPACGSTRALAAFFHGHFAAALAYNRNVVITGPGLVLLMILDVASALRSLGSFQTRACQIRQGASRLLSFGSHLRLSFDRTEAAATRRDVP